jgi:hypothetical protein
MFLKSRVDYIKENWMDFLFNSWLVSIGFLGGYFYVR